MNKLIILFIVNFLMNAESCGTFRCIDGTCLASETMVCDYFVDCNEGEDEFWCAGEKGYPGTVGDSGVKGSNGPRGNRGIQGDDGVNGDVGSPGAVGPVGDNGAFGDIGFPGDDGLIGSQGPKGDTGIAGSQGETGDFGDPGLSGPNGPTGAAGEPGEATHSIPVVLDRCSPSPCAANERCITVNTDVFCTPLVQDNDYWGLLGENLTINVNDLLPAEDCEWSMKDVGGTFFELLAGNPVYQTTRSSLLILNPTYNETRIYRCFVDSTNKTFSFLVQFGTMGMSPCSKSCGLGESFLSLLCKDDIDGRSYCKRLSVNTVPCLNERPCRSCTTCFGGNCLSTYLSECNSPMERCLNIFDTASGLFTYRGCDRLGICLLTRPANNNLKSIDIAGKELVPFCN